MSDGDLRVEKLLKKDLASRGLAAALTTGALGITVYFYCFGVEYYRPWIKFLAVLIFANSLIRFTYSVKIKNQTDIIHRDWTRLQLSILLNTVAWSLIFFLTSLENQSQGPHFLNMIFVLIGFVSAAIVSQGSHFFLFLTMEILFLVPIAGMAFYFYLQDAHDYGWSISVFALIFLFYITYQGRNYRQGLIMKFKGVLDLEKTNRELKASQEALVQQTARLIHSSRLVALGEMASGIAHEINNPLAIISGSLQHLERQFRRGKADQETIQQVTDKALKAINRITGIISGLRHFSRQSDTQSKEEVSLQGILTDTINFCSERLKNHQIKLQISPVPPIKVLCRPIQISQVLINLLKNAEDALNLVQNEKERWISIDFHVNSQLEIRICNGGDKISEQVQSHLFHPFFTTKNIGEGTGLGLSISRGIMQEHAGDLTYDAHKECTCFILTLPLKNIEEEK